MMKQRSLSAFPVMDRRGVVVGILSPIELAAAAVSAAAPQPMSDRRGEGGNNERRTVYPGHQVDP